jgi:transaldolase
MTSKLDQLRAMTTVVADSGDIEAVARLKPVDCTTNPTIVLKALGTPMFADAIKEAVAWGKKQGGTPDAVAAAVADRLAISVGAALSGLVPGRVSTEVDADLSFNTEGSIAKARAIIAATRNAASAMTAFSSNLLLHGKASAPPKCCKRKASTAT